MVPVLTELGVCWKLYTRKWPITIQHDELFDRSTRHQKNIEKDALNSDFSGPRRLLRGNDISFKIGSNRKS